MRKDDGLLNQKYQIECNFLRNTYLFSRRHCSPNSFGFKGSSLEVSDYKTNENPKVHDDVSTS